MAWSIALEQQGSGLFYEKRERRENHVGKWREEPRCQNSLSCYERLGIVLINKWLLGHFDMFTHGQWPKVIKIM